MANDTPVPLNRIERILRNMIASAAGLSIVAIVATIIAGFARIDVNQGIWPTIVVLPFVGLTIAFVLIIAFLIVTVVRRPPVALAERRRRVEHAYTERLSTLLAVGDAELEPAARLDRGPGRKRRRVQEHLGAIVGRDEPEALVFVVELDLAGGHVD